MLRRVVFWLSTKIKKPAGCESGGFFGLALLYLWLHRQYRRRKVACFPAKPVVSSPRGILMRSYVLCSTFVDNSSLRSLTPFRWLLAFDHCGRRTPWTQLVSTTRIVATCAKSNVEVAMRVKLNGALRGKPESVSINIRDLVCADSLMPTPP